MYGDTNVKMVSLIPLVIKTKDSKIQVRHFEMPSSLSNIEGRIERPQTETLVARKCRRSLYGPP